MDLLVQRSMNIQCNCIDSHEYTILEKANNNHTYVNHSNLEMERNQAGIVRSSDASLGESYDHFERTLPVGEEGNSEYTHAFEDGDYRHIDPTSVLPNSKSEHQSMESRTDTDTDTYDHSKTQAS